MELSKLLDKALDALSEIGNDALNNGTPDAQRLGRDVLALVSKFSDPSVTFDDV